MTKKFFCLAINGLHEELFGGPLSQLADFLNRNSPNGVHFNVVGGVDPRPFIFQFQHNIDAAHNGGYEIIIIGHSLGAMMCFYLSDYAKSRGIMLPLVIPIDATDWGTNAPGTTPYALNSATPGQYWCPDNVDRMIYYRQPVYPGGGQVHRADGNDKTALESYERVEAHVVLPVLRDIQMHILNAVLKIVE